MTNKICVFRIVAQLLTYKFCYKLKHCKQKVQAFLSAFIIVYILGWLTKQFWGLRSK